MIRLKFERIQRGLSQAALERATGVFQSVICQIEIGRRNPTRSEIERLSRALGMDPARALDEVVAVAASKSGGE